MGVTSEKASEAREADHHVPAQSRNEEKGFTKKGADAPRTAFRGINSRLAGLAFIPRRCRYDPEKPFEFSMGLNVLFAFAGCFTVANLYYTHPILNLIAKEFNVSYETSSDVATLAQAGYAGGLFFLCPLGDLVKRRPFVLWLVWFTATLWLGLCLTKSFAVFEAITFLTAFTTVTPQLMLPLVGQLAPPHRRATSLSIVVSGMLLGMLIARLLSGVVADFIGWRYIYWIAFGLQYIILILLWAFMPDYPSTNPGRITIKKYFILLWDIVRLIWKHPVLFYACLIGMFTSCTFTSYWTTLTFLLAGPLYNYSSLYIGLFALCGIVAMSFGPVFARSFADKRHPLLSVIIGESICLTGCIIGAYTGRITVAGPIIQAMCIDAGLQTSQISNRVMIYAIDPKARNRVNTAYMVSVFAGQIMGTAVGNRLYAAGGWIASGSASVGFVGFALLLCFVRGPHEKGWIGWGGGWNLKNKKVEEKVQTDEEKGGPQESEEGNTHEKVAAQNSQLSSSGSSKFIEQSHDS